MYYDGWMLPSILQGPLGTVQVTKYFGEGGGLFQCFSGPTRAISEKNDCQGLELVEKDVLLILKTFQNSCFSEILTPRFYPHNIEFPHPKQT